MDRLWGSVARPVVRAVRSIRFSQCILPLLIATGCAFQAPDPVEFSSSNERVADPEDVSLDSGIPDSNHRDGANQGRESDVGPPHDTHDGDS